MPIRLICPHCRKQIQIPNELVGKQARCPYCKGAFQAGPPKASATAAPSPPVRKSIQPPIQSPRFSRQPPALSAAARPPIVRRARSKWIWFLSVFLCVLLAGSGLATWLILHSSASDGDNVNINQPPQILPINKWKRISTPDKQAEIQLPVDVVKSKIRLQTPTGMLTTHKYEWRRPEEGMECFFGYFDLSKRDLQLVPIVQRFQGAKQQVLRRPGTGLLSETDITLRGQPGRQFVFDFPSGATAIARCYFIRHGSVTRFYTLVIAGPGLEKDSPSVKKLFGSFKVYGIPDQLISLNNEPGNPDSITQFDMTPDGRHIVAVTSRRKMHVWNSDTGKRIAVLEAPFQPGRQTIAVMSDNRTMATLMKNNRMQRWDLPTGKMTKEHALPSDKSTFTTLAYALKSNTILVGDARGSHLMLDVYAKDSTHTLRTQSGLLAAAFAPDGTIVATATEQLLQIWSTTDGKETAALSLYPRMNSPASRLQLVYAPDGKTLAVLKNTAIEWWNTSSALLEKKWQHTQNLNVCCFSPDGKWFAAGSSDGYVWLWDAQNGQARAQWQVQTDDEIGNARQAVGGLAFLPSGKQLAIAAGAEIQVWAVEEFLHKPVPQIAPFESMPKSADGPITIAAHDSNIEALHFTDSDKTLVTLSANGVVRRWKLNPFRIVKSGPLAEGFYQKANPMHSAAVRHDGRQIAVVNTSDRKILALDIATAQTASAPAMKFAPIWLDFMPNSNSIAYVASNQLFYVQNVMQPGIATPVKLEIESPSRMAFAPDGKSAVLIVDNKKLVELEMPDYNPTGNGYYGLESFGAGSIGFCSAAQYSPDNRYLITVDSGGPSAPPTHRYALRVWNAASRNERWHFRSRSAILAMDVSRDGKQLAAVAKDGSIWAWDLETGKNRIAVKRTSPMNHVAFAPNGDALVFAVGRNLVVWPTSVLGSKSAAAEADLKSSLLEPQKRDKFGMFAITTGRPTANLLHMVFDSDNKTLTTIDRSGAVKQWDAETGLPAKTEPKSFGRLARLTILADAPDRESGIAVSASGAASEVFYKSGDIKPGPKRKGRLRSAAFSRAGRTLAAGYGDSKVIFWKTSNWMKIREWKVPFRNVDLLAYSPDGRWLAAAGGPEPVQLWNAIFRTAEVGPPEFTKGKNRLDHFVRAIAFSPNGDLLASATYDGRVRMWDVSKKKTAWDKQSTDTFNNNRGAGRILTFTPDGERLITAGETGGKRYLRVWNVANGENQELAFSPVTSIGQATFSDDGRYLAVRSGHIVDVWDTEILWKAMAGS